MPRCYTSGVSDQAEHSRRDFLSGRGAAHSLVGKLQQLADRATGKPPTSKPSPHKLLVQASRRAMACEFQVTYHQTDVHTAESALQALDQIEELESQLTVYRAWSEVIDLNQRAARGPVQVEPHLFALLQEAKQLSLDTGGAFDITSTPLSRVWGFLKRDGRRPTEQEISAAVELVGSDQILLDDQAGTAEFAVEGMEINLNSIGKGYALDRVTASMDELGAKDYLWHGGSSSVLARGRNRSQPEPGWTIGLRNPQKPEHRLAEFVLRNRALATAGGGTQFFEEEGVRYSHIIDPRTGRPTSGRFTATVLAPRAATADALATAFFVMDEAEITNYCRDCPDIAAVVVSDDSGEKGVRIDAWRMTEQDWRLLDECPLVSHRL